MSCGKVCEEGLPKVKLEQEGEESWKGSVKKDVEVSLADASRKYMARVGLKLEIAFLSGSEAGVPEAARVIFKTRQTRQRFFDELHSNSNFIAEMVKLVVCLCINLKLVSCRHDLSYGFHD